MARRKKKTEEQMDIFEDGGLKDEGGTVDPVSGNDVPAGSTQSEVRDDIPAQLSEGEFVLPADVVRYIGLENLMELRNKAKQGLSQMEAMGQMGNSEEATMPDTAEMNVDIDALIDEFDPNDPETQNFNEGGMPTYQYQPAQNIYGQQNYNPYLRAQQPQQFTTGYMPQATYTAPSVPTINQGQFSQTTSPQGGQVEQRQYMGPNGELRTFTFIDGKPTEEIPAGFKVYKPEEQVTPEVVKPQVHQFDTGGGDGDGPSDTDSSSPPDLGYSKQQAVDVLSEIDAKLGERYNALPEGIMGALKNGLIPSAIKAIQYGITERDVINQFERGYGLGTTPTGEYADWRSNVDNVYLAASMLDSENEAREVAKTGEVGGSSFSSREEAEAVAEHGWGSDEHINSIDPDDGIGGDYDFTGTTPSTPGADWMGTDVETSTPSSSEAAQRAANKAEAERNAAKVRDSGGGGSDDNDRGGGGGGGGGSSDSFGGGRDADGWGE